MKLNGKQISELKSCVNSRKPIWRGVPPDKADADLSAYIFNGLVEWVGNGYRITHAGRAALAQGGGE